MYYTVYKITNLVKNKIYVGVHKTSNLEDDYMGSGKLIKLAIEKYGLENFTKEYIAIFDNAEEMFNMEAMLVNEEFVKRDDTYNLKEGGFGGWDFNCSNLEMQLNKLQKARDKLKILREDDKFKTKVSKNISLALKESYKKGNRTSFLKGSEFKGKSHSEESKKKIGKSVSIRQSGEGNSQFGTIWIYNSTDNINKKIRKDELCLYESFGWIKGRKIKV